MTFYLTTAENRTKNLWHSSHTAALKKILFCQKNANFLFEINADFRKSKGILALWENFFETTCVSAVKYQISGF